MSLPKIFHILIGDKSATLDDVKVLPDKVIFHARIKKKKKKCGCCGSSKVQQKDSKKRTLRACNLSNQKAYIEIITYKLLCLSCGKRAWMKLPFAMGKYPLTKSFVNYIISLIGISTLLHVARLFSLQWKTVKNLDKENLKRRPKQFSFKKLEYLSIDEIAIRKGHHYMTIISDIATGQIIYAVEGRKEEVLVPFLKKLKHRARKLKAIAMDMSAGYAGAVKKYLSHIAIVFDRFHVTKVLTGAVDEVRKEEWKRCLEQGHNVAKGKRFLLLRNFDNLDASGKAGLEELLRINEKLAIAHSMKEQFRLFWDQPTREEGCKFLSNWIVGAISSEVKPLQKAARTLLNHWEGLLNYFDHKIDNGKAEGINNKIKTMKRQAYGFRDIEYFILKLYNLHKTTHVLVGC
jgi:transposase